MKQYIIFLFGLLILNACSDDQYLAQQKKVEEGIPTEIKLSLSIPESDQVQTKSFVEQTVSELYVFSFKEGNDGAYIASAKYADTPSSAVSFETLSGEQQIYGIANTSYDMFPYVSETLEGWLKSPPTKSEFLSLMAEVGGDKAIQFANTTALMSGLWTDTDGGEVCSVKKDGTTEADGRIVLKRVSSEVNFKIKVKEGRTFQLESYQVCEIPGKVNLWGTSQSGDFYSTLEQTVSDHSNTITFYMAENIATGRNCLTEDDREVLSKGSLRNSAPEDRAFKNVDKATYVLLKGSYSAVDNGKTTEAKVVYCIHLGLGAGQDGDHNDFSTYRNKKYTYDVTVNGVNNIITEVTVKDRDFPREEGDVIVSASAKVLYLDSHFEAREMTFTKSELMASGTNFTFYVKDPNTSFKYVERPTADTSNWVCFKKYVGDYRYPGDDSNDLISVEVLLDNLRAWVKGEESIFKDNADEVKLVCFVNEYYYQNMRWSRFVNTDDREMLIICKTESQESGGNSTYTTNASYVIRQDPIQTVYNLSEDYKAWGIETVNETDLLKSASNPTSEDLLNIAYGRMNLPSAFSNGKENWETYQDYSKPSDGNMMKSAYQNAYYACLQRNRDENGNGVIDKKEVKWYLASSGQYISLWLGRSALSTESSLFNIGDWTSEGFVSYIPNKYHYIPSDKSEKEVFWAEEGITIGKDGGHVSGNERNYRCVRDLNVLGEDEKNLEGNDKPKTVFTISAQNTITAPVDVEFAYLNSNSLKSAASISELDPHTERDNAINKPYKKFAIYSGDIADQKEQTWDAKTKLTGPGTPCSALGRGWRMPNQTELSVIYLIATDAGAYGPYGGSAFRRLGNKTIFARSAYSGIARGGSLGAHAYRLKANENVSLVKKNGDKGRIRCVKDTY